MYSASDQAINQLFVCFVPSYGVETYIAVHTYSVIRCFINLTSVKKVIVNLRFSCMQVSV